MKCAECPIAGRCVAEDPAHAYACKFAVSPHASERRWLEDASALVAGRPLPEAKPVAAANPAPPPTRPIRAAAGPSLADFADNLAKVQSCRSRVAGPECGCAAKMRCLKHAKDATLEDCLRCVAAGLADLPSPATDPEP